MPSSPSDIVLLFAHIFFSFELISDLTALVIACLNLAIIVPTKLLHANLKSILITQSVLFVLYLVARSLMLVQKFFSKDIFAQGKMILQSTVLFSAIFRRLLGHALIIERFIATFTIALFNTTNYDHSWVITRSMLLTSSFSMALSFFEYLSISLIERHNRRKYCDQIENATGNTYNIGRRLNVLDNVRSAKQLSPTFLCLFISNFCLSVVYIAMACNAFPEAYQISLAFAVASWVDAMLGAATELTIMTHHPVLNKRLANHLKIIFHLKFRRVNAAQQITAETALDCGENVMDMHFKMLQESWNK
ncbi:hypothetical protein niasHS_007750 [Heterodera schachtii]|uniref:Gustatory receptor n=1 Tax=Heterodera schachtii TaxID=97005 RepID=A0ABD2JPK4_HETSC